MEVLNVTGNYHNCPPLLNDSADFVLCACGSAVRQVSSKSGELVSTFAGHEFPITNLAWDKKTPNMLYSSSLDGVLLYWNYKTKAILNRWQLNAPIYQILVPLSKENEIYLVLGKGTNANNVDKGEVDTTGSELIVQRSGNSGFHGKNQEPFKLVSYNLLKQKIHRKISTLWLAYNSCCLTKLNNDEYLLSVNKRKLFMWNIQSPSLIGYRAITESVHSITSITATASTYNLNQTVEDGYTNYKQLVVTGHENGEILVWHDLAKWITRQPIITFRFNPETMKRDKVIALPSALQSNGNATNSGISSEDRSAFIQNAAPVCTVMHWHAHTVHALALSVDSRQLYSGGEEGVFVVWQMENGMKSYLPRLGASIAGIGSNRVDARAVVTTTDNCIRLVNTSSLKEEWILRSIHMGSYCNIHQWKQPSKLTPRIQAANPFDPLLSDPSTYRSQLRIEPRSNYVVGNGIPSLLQFYDISTLTYRNTLPIVQYQRISKTEKNIKMFIPTVTMFVFGRYKLNQVMEQAGCKASVITTYDDYLATVDVLKGEEMLPETSLKIWKFDGATGSYKLVVQIDRPHEGFKITSLEFTPDTNSNGEGNAFIGLVTGASNGAIKMWYCNNAASNAVLMQSKHVSRVSNENTWKCLYSFAYKDCPIKSLCFSRDGSVLCLTHQNLVSFWDPIGLVLKGTVVIPTPNKVQFVQFIEPCYESSYGSGTGECWLFVGSKRSVTVINALTMSVHWSINTGKYDCFAVAQHDMEALTVSETKKVQPYSRTLKGWIAAVATDAVTNQKQIQLFDPISSIPVYTSVALHCGVTSILYYNNSFNTIHTHQPTISNGLLFVTDTSELRSLGEVVKNTAGVGTLSEVVPGMATVYHTKAPQVLIGETVAASNTSLVIADMNHQSPTSFETMFKSNGVANKSNDFMDIVKRMLPRTAAAVVEKGSANTSSGNIGASIYSLETSITNRVQPLSSMNINDLESSKRKREDENSSNSHLNVHVPAAPSMISIDQQMKFTSQMQLLMSSMLNDSNVKSVGGKASKEVVEEVPAVTPSSKKAKAVKEVVPEVVEEVPAVTPSSKKAKAAKEVVPEVVEEVPAVTPSSKKAKAAKEVVPEAVEEVPAVTPSSKKAKAAKEVAEEVPAVTPSSKKAKAAKEAAEEVPAVTPNASKVRTPSTRTRK